MSVFLLPVRVCDSLEKMFNRYWWGGGGTRTRGIHWLSWDRMCIPKPKGGFGFKRLHDFNMALLAKQGWRLLIHPESLVTRLLKAKYYPMTEFMDAQIGQNPSFIWHSILAGRRALQLGVARRVGDGRDTKIWGWEWLAGPANDIPRILATPVNNQFRDSWRWKGDIRGCYTVQHGYRLLVGEANLQGDTHGFTAWKAIWALPIPPKVIVGSLVDEAVRLAIGIWTIWLSRNEVVWNNKQPSAMTARAQVLQLQSCWTETYKVQSTASTHAVTWSPPPSNFIKCNIDAALSGDGASYGAVVRDSEGQFVAAKCGRLEGVVDPYIAEVLGVKEALLWLSSQHRRNIIIESDCLNFCTAFNSCSFDFSCVGLLVKQCLSIASIMENVSVSHVKRSSNRVAYELARATVSMAGSEVWTEIPPACIMRYLNQ
ncbi:PREDICTED: uncharacterized protein LOC109160490 [Ipomoea nil]|uniref:uncharacterized protein LOC109160490 n=1 Tax=Ipomoea nil TaxID=35883 RepID=UPI000900FC8F|nr:PREDICTED: uncharacterized protein LOC109160490 [Ipomoea nil]